MPALVPQIRIRKSFSWPISCKWCLSQLIGYIHAILDMAQDRIFPVQVWCITQQNGKGCFGTIHIAILSCHAHGAANMPELTQLSGKGLDQHRQVNG